MSKPSRFRLLIDALKLSRVNNLIIIFLTQYLGAIFLTDHHYVDILLDFDFFVMVLSTSMIAAAGYYINDYYDIKIDLINKPSKVIVGKSIRRRPVMFAHTTLNVVGVILAAWVSPWLGLINLVIAALLWWYSNQLKRLPLAGNVLVAFMTSATLLVLMVYFQSSSMLIYTYALFAFGITLIREIVKDVEDMEGDASHGGNTLPVTIGVRKTKYFLFLVIFFYLGFLTYFLLLINNTFLNYYFIVLLVPFLHFVKLLYNADTKQHFTRLSTYCKWIILAGIGSMSLLGM